MSVRAAYTEIDQYLDAEFVMFGSFCYHIYDLFYEPMCFMHDEIYGRYNWRSEERRVGKECW